ncbi:SRPBCC family protein [Sphingomonas radiodurans]|uniref:SRPBCC family protein n=1 Tax=Sphingomonas radiodurans TaxID=2890321 RepID=UPI001E49577F|nr:SRPBCC family protein [Sphingomonas radiodurans]WBH17832.1 SRPBCC family protein [Sphingomonas radiodurans]
MADTIHQTSIENGQADDSPVTTTKNRSDAVEAATGSLIDAPADGNADTLVGRTVTINKPRAELYAYWRDFPRLATFMENVERIEPLDDRRTHWVVKAPGGTTVEWTAAITDEREGEYIAWASEEGADVPNSGRVDFRDAQGDRGTIVTATILYDPPAGIIGKVIAKMFQREPAIQARRDLRRFKQLMETGEIATGARNQRLLDEGKN